MTCSISNHAVNRYRERVDQLSQRREANRVLRDAATRGRRRANPRHWMRRVRHEPGTSFIYDASRPGMCLVVRGGAVVTVLTRQMFRGNPMAVTVNENRALDAGAMSLGEGQPVLDEDGGTR